MTWEVFRDGINARPNQFLDFFAELMILQQVSLVQDYHDKFEKLLAKERPMEQSQQVTYVGQGLQGTTFN